MIVMPLMFDRGQVLPIDRTSQFDVQKKREQPVRMTRHPFENRSVDCLGQHLSRLGEQLITIVRTAKPCLKRPEEDTSELQSLMRSSYAVFCLKKKHQISTARII